MSASRARPREPRERPVRLAVPLQLALEFRRGVAVRRSEVREHSLLHESTVNTTLKKPLLRRLRS